MPLDDLLKVLKDHEVGLWCRRAAWAIALLETVLLVLNLLGILAHPDPLTLPINLLTAVIGYLIITLWYFFVLYALGVLVDRLAR
jgi:hypothetical protein